MKIPPSPWLRASLAYEQGLEQSGYYREKPAKTFTIWLIVIVAATLAFTMSGHHQKEEKIQINKKEIMQRQNFSAAQHAMNTELFIMKQAANSGTMMDQYHASSTRSKQ